MTHNHQWRSEIQLKPILRSLRTAHVSVSNGRKATPELRDEDEDIHDQTDPRAVDCGLGFVC